MYLLWEIRVHTIEQVFKTSFVGIVRQIDQLFKFLLESVPQEPIVNAGDSGHVDTIDAKELHLLGVESGSDQVHTGREPLVRGFTFLESNVSTSLQLGHQPMNVLLGHLINLFP